MLVCCDSIVVCVNICCSPLDESASDESGVSGNDDIDEVHDIDH